MFNLTGQKFGRLEVIARHSRDINRQIIWSCVCDCGNLRTIRSRSLRDGSAKSCGCLQKELAAKRVTTHGQTKHKNKTKEYRAWDNVKQRCHNPKDKSYDNYGGRGITMCPRWLGKDGFANFLADMGECPEGMSLDRKDNNMGYILSNCRWATWEEQENNRRDNHWIEYKGERKTLAQWAKHLGIKQVTLQTRLNKLGWSDERALTTPTLENKGVKKPRKLRFR